MDNLYSAAVASMSSKTDSLDGPHLVRNPSMRGGSSRTPDADSLPSSVNQIRNSLSAQWTIIYQMSDIAVFMSLSGLSLCLHFPFNDVSP